MKKITVLILLLTLGITWFYYENQAITSFPLTVIRTYQNTQKIYKESSGEYNVDQNNLGYVLPNNVLIVYENINSFKFNRPLFITKDHYQILFVFDLSSGSQQWYVEANKEPIKLD